MITTGIIYTIWLLIFIRIATENRKEDQYFSWWDWVCLILYPITILVLGSVLFYEMIKGNKK